MGNFFNFEQWKKIIFSFSIIILSALASSESSGQERDSRGNEFWFTFLPNFHSGGPVPDSLYIIIAADVPTKGTITYSNAFGDPKTVNFTINNPAQLYTFRTHFSTYELTNVSEEISFQSFHIEADEEITVYALNQAQKTSDAFMLLPVDVLGTDYYVLTYNSDGYNINNGLTPSQFAIVASQDETEVVINPTAPTVTNGMNQQKVTLNQGEVYLVQAFVNTINPRNDLTGTKISSNKPVAVFAGHQRASIPINFGGRPSRDCLVEQLPAVNNWGKNAFLTPHHEPIENGGNSGTNDIYRILSGRDNNRIMINGVQIAVLNEGKFLEGALTSAMEVQADGPILVAQFRKTAEPNSFDGKFNTGDPFMMLIPPVEQFMSSYRFTNVQIFAEKPTGDYQEQYMNIVALTSSIPSIRLDGAPIQASAFKQIFTTPYSYASLQMKDGVHSVTADTTFGIYVYGYGDAVSYGYIGGMSFRDFDYLPPRINRSLFCSRVSGKIFDNATGDSRILSVNVPDSTRKNIAELNINIQGNKADSATFSAELANVYADGEFMIEAKDHAGLIRKDSIRIPGFTIHAAPYSTGNEIIFTETKFPFGRKFCTNITLHNYGKFTQKISADFISGQENFTASGIPAELAPGDSAEITVCFTSDSEGIFTDTLRLSSPCFSRNIFAIQLEARGDKDPPKLAVISDSCQFRTSLTITDSSFYDRQLMMVESVDSLTKNISLNRSDNFPLTVEYMADVIDPYQDAYYSIRAIDSAGNETVFNGSIPGFTVSFAGMDSTRHVFGSSSIGYHGCDTIMLYNYGHFPMTFQKADLFRNLDFSLPLAQFPITVMPGEKIPLELCFRPVIGKKEIFNDTLTIRTDCLQRKIAVTGESEILIRPADTRCGVPVKLTTSTVPFATFLEQNYPNPSADESTILFGVHESKDLELRLYDLYGNSHSVISSGNFSPGIYEVKISLQDLPAGIYIYELANGEEKISRTMTVVK